MAEGNDSNATAVIEAARQGVKPQELDTSKVYHVGTEYGDVVDLERLLDNPRRRKGTYTAATVESFTDIVDRLGAEGVATTIWVTHDTPYAVEAVFNDNTADAAGWGDLRVRLPLELTPEWNHWASLDGALIGQEDFAEHIESGIKELVEPEAAVMLEIAQSIHATVSATFRSAKRLADGETQMVYEEQIEGSAGQQKGELKIPDVIKLAIAPFLGEDTYAVSARFRYRLGGGNLRVGYKLERPEDVILDALEQIKKRLDEKYDAVYMGAAAKAR
jgi:uncharacterized protein YfdQ (DUF2303 family)